MGPEQEASDRLVVVVVAVCQLCGESVWVKRRENEVDLVLWSLDEGEGERSEAEQREARRGVLKCGKARCDAVWRCAAQG